MSLIKNLSVYTTFSFIEKAIYFLLPMALTYYLSPDELGLLANFTVLTQIFTILITMGTQTAVAVEYYKKVFDNFSSYVYTGLVNIVVSFLIMSISILLLSTVIEKFLFLPFKFSILIPIISLSVAVFGVILAIFQTSKEVFLYGLSTLTKAILYLALTLSLLIIFNLGYSAVIFGLLISNALVVFFLLFYLFKRKTITLSFNRLFSRDLISFGLPLIPHTLGMMLIHSSDRIFISSMIDLDSLGIYHIGYTVTMIISLFILVFNKAWVPYLFEYLKKADNDSISKIRKVSFYYLVIVFVIAIIISIGSPYFMELLLDERYHGASTYVPWIAFSFFLTAATNFFSNFLTYDKFVKPFIYVTGFCTLLNLVLNYFFINIFGVIGAAYSTLITFLILFIIMTYVSIRFSSQAKVVLGIN
ncbi:oligosaccharide flippase family protein [Saprospiraceae bacterium]|nr:oligosaccharide flippase family protein [Saprospiraceae bacterium]